MLQNSQLFAFRQKISAGEGIPVQALGTPWTGPLSDPDVISCSTTQNQQDPSVTQLEFTENPLPLYSAGSSSRESIHLSFSPERTQILNECLSNLFWQ